MPSAVQREQAARRLQDADESMTAQQIAASVNVAAQEKHAAFSLGSLFSHTQGPDTSDTQALTPLPPPLACAALSPRSTYCRVQLYSSRVWRFLVNICSSSMLVTVSVPRNVGCSEKESNAGGVSAGARGAKGSRGSGCHAAPGACYGAKYTATQHA